MSSSFFRQVIVGGGSGFLGQALRSLLTRSGFNVITISRSSQMGLTWSDVEREGLPDAYAVINLSGAGVMDEKLSTERKQALIQSRVATNQILLKAIEARSARGESVPNVFIGTSAVGYYPVDTNMKYDETWRTPSLGFASALCEATEQSMRAEWTHPGLAETRRVVIRVGVVLGHGGGIMKVTLPQFYWGFGGLLGDGTQILPWIHIDDAVAMYLHAIQTPIAGVLNAVAPAEDSYGTFARSVASALHRPCLFRMPAFVLRMMLQERADILLGSQRIVPTVALNSGFVFRYPQLQTAVQDVVKSYMTE
eukprot:TRINITY_DN3995_c0_g1_i2.p1 TRINITY_DN3995_c0_g1~~TRINITY_DN3995_c0_g1_i2.p1  ORF type:complete len:309 (+),score=61.68 TRINITY_DN3995_c0_g1_i2:48-974(+)